VVLRQDQATGEWVMASEAVEAVKQLARKCDLYLITRCDDDATEARVRQQLQDHGVFSAGMNPHVRVPNLWSWWWHDGLRLNVFV
jgi:hypothetical protein